MSTPCAIRFLNRDNKPFTGVYIHSDCQLDFVIESILEASKFIVPFPIRVMSTDKRAKCRSMSAEKRNCEEKDLKFAYGIDKYAIAFSSAIYNIYDIYEDQRGGIKFDFGDGFEETEPEFFSGAEDFISALDLNSGYKGNIVYLVDVSFPEKTELGLDYEPLITIETGSGNAVFKGTRSQLELKKLDLIKSNI